MRTGLVLEGGAMRGMFTAGVLDVLMERGLEFDGLAGVSAGACFGCNYKSRQPGRAIRYNTKYCSDPRYCGIRSLVKTGDLFGVDFCYREIPKELDVFDHETFRENPMDFYVVCTDADTGETVYHKCEGDLDEDLKWIQASASMPGVSRPVELEGRRLLDGGIVDAIPLKFMEDEGYDKNVVILTQPRDFLKEETKALPVMKVLLRQIPKIYAAMKVRHHEYNRQTAYVRKKEKLGEIFVIRPSEKLPIGRVEKDPEKLRVVYEIGRKTAQERLPELMAFLEVENHEN